MINKFKNLEKDVKKIMKKGFTCIKYIVNSKKETDLINSPTLTDNQINLLRQDTIGWLNTNNFESVQQIITSENSTNINNLIVQFQNADWQAINT